MTGDNIVDDLFNEAKAYALYSINQVLLFSFQERHKSEYTKFIYFELLHKFVPDILFSLIHYF